MLLRNFFLASALSSALFSPFVSSQDSTGSTIDPNGPVGSCPYTQVYLNDFTLTLTPDGSSTAIDILPDFTPAYDATSVWSYVVERGDDLPTGTITFTPTSITDYATFRIKFNHGDYIYATVGEAVTAPLIAGSDLIEFDVIQAPCAGTDIQEYSITLYQNGSSIIPPPTSTAPSSGEDQTPTLPSSSPSEESSTAAAAPPTTCADTPVYLNSFSLFITPSGSSSQIDFGPYITPAYSPSGPEFFYVIERGDDLPTGTITFNPLDFTSGSTFRIQFNGQGYTYLNPGESVEADLIAGTDLIQFDVIQPPCGGTDIQEYSITLYQNGTSKIPPPTAPIVITPTPPVTAPDVPPVQPPTVMPTPPMMSSPVACQAITFSQAVIANSDDSSLLIEFNNTATDRSVSWVDFHVSINANLIAGSSSASAPQFNYRMKATEDVNEFLLTFPTGLDDVTLTNLAYINYFFTYCSESTDCNTDVFNFAVAPPSGADSGSNPNPSMEVTCAAINFTQYTSTSGTAAANDETFSFSWYSTTPDVMIGWVDIHVTIASATVNGQYNYRMFESPVPADAASQFTSGFVPSDIFFITMPGVDGVTIPDDATVTYFFTYCAQSVDCNSQNFNFNRNPAQGGAVVGQSTPTSSGMVSGVCPAVTYVPSFEREEANPNILTVNFTVTSTDSMVQWVDLHVTINTALLADGLGAYSPSYNYRMTQVNGTVFTYTFPGIDGVSVPSTSYVDYFFTYCAMDTAANTQTDCNTDPGTFGASQAIGLVVTENKIDTTFGANGNVNNTNIQTNQNAATAKSATGAVFITAIAAVMALLL